MTQSILEVVHRFYANTAPFYVRDLCILIFVSLGVLEPISEGTEEQLYSKLLTWMNSFLWPDLCAHSWDSVVLA
jgi:hypothetical protein